MYQLKQFKSKSKTYDTADYTDFGANKYNFEVLENPEKYTIIRVHCNSAMNSLEKVSYQISKRYYCTKKKHQEAALNRK